MLNENNDNLWHIWIPRISLNIKSQWTVERLFPPWQSKYNLNNVSIGMMNMMIKGAKNGKWWWKVVQGNKREQQHWKNIFIQKMIMMEESEEEERLNYLHLFILLTPFCSSFLAYCHLYIFLLVFTMLTCFRFTCLLSSSSSSFWRATITKGSLVKGWKMNEWKKRLWWWWCFYMLSTFRVNWFSL